MPSSTSRALQLLFLAIAVIVAVLLLRPDLLERLRGPAETIDPCATPLAWHIRDIDPRFGFTRRELQGAVREAAGLWEEAGGRRFFRRDTAASMAIDLVYDTRQRVYEAGLDQEAELIRIEAELRSLENLIDRAEARVEEVRTRHERRRTAATAESFRSAVQRYNGAVDQYNRAVDRYNRALEAARSESGDLTAGDLYAERRTLGGRVVSVDRVLTVAVAGSYEDLVLVLTHELGHALGLGHLPDPDAIMAERFRQQNTPTRVRLSPADSRALAELCGLDR